MQWTPWESHSDSERVCNPNLMHASNPWRVPQLTLGASSIPSGPWKLPFSYTAGRQGWHPWIGDTTVSNEFLTTRVWERVEEESGRQRLREQNLTPNALKWFVDSPLSWCKRTPASDHRGVKCTLWGRSLAPHWGPNDVWNVLIKFCLFIQLTICLMGWKLWFCL